jgi:hypothetical protein
VKERGLLFSAPMVRDLLDGSKTQTRRIVKIKGLDFVGSGSEGGQDWNDPSCWGFEDGNTGLQWALAASASVDQVFRSPYGQPGARLWVREAWRTVAEANSMPPRDLSPAHRIWYEADCSLTALRGLTDQGKYRPSMFMPRWASRITLEVTGVRVERLQDISEADAIAEGVSSDPTLRGDDDLAVCQALRSIEKRTGLVGGSLAIARYMVLWESLNGPLQLGR